MKGRGVVYILTNNSYAPDLLKIGMSRRSASVRADEIYSNATGIPEPFIIAIEVQVENCVTAEELIHRKLKKYRVNNGREFFKISLDLAKEIIFNVVDEVNQLYAQAPIELEDEYYQKPSQNLINITPLAEGGLVEFCKSKYSQLISEPPVPKVMISTHFELFDAIAAAKKGDADAQFSLGRKHKDGEDGLKINLADAKKWYVMAAEQGHALASLSIGMLYVLEKDYSNAMHWFNKASKLENYIADYFIGRFYYYGRGVDIDFVEASKWFKKPAMLGWASTQDMLGRMYLNGEGVEENQFEGAKWIKKAAVQGYAQAQYNLGYCFIHGKGKEIDINSALVWFCFSALQGQELAQLALGDMYHQGTGVTQDYIHTHAWWSLAAKSKNEEAMNRLNMLKNNMSSDDIKASHKLIATWMGIKMGT